MPGREGQQFGPLVAKRPKEPTPFLKWAGGKWRLLGQMKAWFPRRYDTYIEPFLGGGAVFFHLRPRRGILGDANAELMNVYSEVRDNVELLMSELDKHEPEKNDEDYYRGIREQVPDKLDSAPRAARTILLNKTCYNGLYRVNSKGQFNVPFGRNRNPQLYERDNLIACSSALRGQHLVADDYRVTTRYARERDFVYLDPPYQPLGGTSNFTAYTKEAFDEDDQKELAATVARLDNKGCQVMLSNSSTDFIRDLYADYHVEIVRATRPISSKAETRGEIEELLIKNY